VIVTGAGANQGKLGGDSAQHVFALLGVLPVVDFEARETSLDKHLVVLENADQWLVVKYCARACSGVGVGENWHSAGIPYDLDGPVEPGCVVRDVVGAIST